VSDDPAADRGKDAGPSPGADPGDDAPARPEPAWMRLIAPLRSEDAAFRMVVWAAAAALTLAVLVVLVRLVT